MSAAPARHRTDTPARRVIRIIRIIRSYGHTAAWHCATLPRLPGIEASPAAPPDRVFFLPLTRPSFNRLLAWAQDCPKKPITGPSPKVCQRCCEDGIADIVFFSPFTRPTVNPGVGTGLPHSILAWAQDCPTQSWRGHRIATLNPGVGTGLPRCFPENAGSAVLYSTTPPDSPPGKLRCAQDGGRCPETTPSKAKKHTVRCSFSAGSWLSTGRPASSSAKSRGAFRAQHGVEVRAHLLHAQLQQLGQLPGHEALGSTSSTLLRSLMRWRRSPLWVLTTRVLQGQGSRSAEWGPPGSSEASTC